MSATPHRHLLMFAELTGPKSAKNVVLATTMWDKLHPEIVDEGSKRENDLKEYWKDMLDHGAAIERFLNTSDSTWDIIDNVIKNDRKAVLLLQEELVDQKKHLLATSAGRALFVDRVMQDSTGYNSSSESVTLGTQESK